MTSTPLSRKGPIWYLGFSVADSASSTFRQKQWQQSRHVTIPSDPSVLRIFYFTVNTDIDPAISHAMSATIRTSLKMASRPQQAAQRLASIQRQFSSSAPQRKEVRDAFILSASRTPTGVVCCVLDMFESTPISAVQRRVYDRFRNPARRNRYKIGP